MRILLLGVSLLTMFRVGLVEAQSPSVRQKLIVGTKTAPPFAMQQADGSWHGISIELWQAIANDLNLDFELQERDLQGLLAGVQDSSLDLAVAALTVTAKREELFDFSHPFYTTGLGIAVPLRGGNVLFGVLSRLFSWEFFEVIMGLGVLLCIVGALVWFFERKRNSHQFDARFGRGLWAGFWWAAVTMTTVGYGDKAPQTLVGRIIALIWMFAAIIMISGFTAAITTVLTVAELGTSIRGPDDLSSARVGTLQASTSDEYLHEHRLVYQTYKTLQAGLTALVNAEIDAMVYDAPLLRYFALLDYKGKVEVLSATFERQDYAIAMPTGSDLREPMNRVLLDKIRQPEWRDVLFRYLGK